MSETVPPAKDVYPVGLVGMMLITFTLLFALFITNLGEGKEADLYFRIGLFYCIMGGLSVSIIYSTVNWVDPRKNSTDFLAFFCGFFPFVAVMIMSGQFTSEYTILLSLSVPLLQLLVASAEEAAFRITLPRIFYNMAGGNKTVRWFFAGIVSCLLFSLFHAHVYNMDQAKLLSAFVFGCFQYVTFAVAVGLSQDGSLALPGIIGSHWLLNLYLLGEDWVLWGFYYIVAVLMVMLVMRGYRFKRTRQPKRGKSSIGWS